MSALSRRLFARQPLEWTPGDNQGPTLRRALRWPGLTAIGLGTMLGGIFPTVGPGILHAGPAVVVSFALVGAICVAVAFCYAEFASMVPVAGSAYTYAYATLGEIVAWIIGWDLILEYGLSVAPTASSFSTYAQGLLAEAHIALPMWAQTAWAGSGTFHVDVLAAAITLAITALVAIGIRESARANASLVIVQIVAMIVFVVALIPFVHPSNLHPFAPFGWHGIMYSAGLVFFAYIGFDTVTVASEEAHKPERDVPIGIILSLIIGVILFCTIAFVTAGTISYSRIGGDGGAAMTDAISANLHSPWVLFVVGIGGVAGNFTVMLTSLLGQIRIFYVMARDRMLPPNVATIHPKFRTPARMTLITGGIVAVLAAVLPLSDLLALVNIGTLVAFAIVCVGVFVLRIVRPDAHRPFRAPLGTFCAVLGALGCIYVTGFLDWPTWVRFASWFVIGIGVYAGYGYWHSRLRNSASTQPLPPPAR